MLHLFLSDNRAELVARCRAKVVARALPSAVTRELDHGISVFLDQLIRTLQVEQTPDPMLSREVSGPTGGGQPALSEMGATAAAHGRELMQHGFSVEELVHDYGDLCQAITDLALEGDAPIEVDEFRTLNRCLDNAIAMAITEYGYQRDYVVADRQADALNERLGNFAHELRNQLSTATLALSVIKEGHLAIGSATGAVLDRSLVNLRNLIDRSLLEVRITAGVAVQVQLFSLAAFISEVKSAGELEAHVVGCVFQVSDVDPALAVDADRDLLFAAVGNLLSNAFKFTRPGSKVTLHAYASADRILIDVKDQCGGLATGDAELLFQPFHQSSKDRSGLGLGLSISRRSVEANHGRLSVRDRPGFGCSFTIDLPRHAMVDQEAIVDLLDRVVPG